MDRNTLYKAREEWLKEGESKPETLHNYKYPVNLLMEWMEENGYEILDDALLKAFKAKLEKEFHVNTKSMYLVGLRNFLRFCKREGFTDLDLAESLNFHREKMVSPEILEELLEKIDTDTLLGARDAALLILLAETEMGPSCIYRLKCGDLHDNQISCMIGGFPSIQTLSERARKALSHYFSLREDVADEAPLLVNKNNSKAMNPNMITVTVKMWKEA